MIGLPTFFAEYQAAIDTELRRVVPDGADAVARSMTYTLHAPSKRVRPVLTLLACEICGGKRSAALVPAAAIEMVHAASLILDDLPSMDDAPLRRSRPANHREFGQATAILAAFALLNRAYGAIAESCAPDLAATLSGKLAEAVGLQGLVGGQSADLEATQSTIDFHTLERIHRCKTGALFVAAASAGALVARGSPDAVASLSAFAKNLGLAFQIVDDLLDVEGDPAQTGKALRADARKTTFVSFSGVAGARQLARELCETADRALAPFGRRADRLRELSAFVAARSL